MKKKNILPIIFIVMLWSGSSMANSKELVKSMMISEAALLGMKLSLEEGVSQGTVLEKHFLCVDKTDRYYFLDDYSKIMDENLSNEEISQALEFYTSEAGRKYTLYGVIQLRKSLVPDEEGSYPSFTEKEQKDIVEFGETSAGQKLWKERLLTSKKIKARINALLKVLYDKCKP